MPYKDKEKQKKFQSDWHLKTKDDRKYLRDKAKKALIERNKALVAGVRSKGCSICGYNKCQEALDFHHLDSSIKDIGIKDAVRQKGTEKLKEEIAKCIVVCANCHREIHHLKIHL